MDPLSSTQSPSAKSGLSQAALPASKQDGNKVTPTSPSEKSETITISLSSQEINQYTDAMAELPDVREDRIVQIQAAIESGTYSVSSQNLADKLIQDLST